MSSNETCFFKKPEPSWDIFVRRHRQHAAPQPFEIGWFDRDPVDGSRHLKDTLPKREERFIVPRQSDHVGIQDQLIEPFAKYFPVAEFSLEKWSDGFDIDEGFIDVEDNDGRSAH